MKNKDEYSWLKSIGLSVQEKKRKTSSWWRFSWRMARSCWWVDDSVNQEVISEQSQSWTYSFRHVINIYKEEKRSQYGSLGNPWYDLGWAGMNSFQDNFLLPVSQTSAIRVQVTSDAVVSELLKQPLMAKRMVSTCCPSLSAFARSWMFRIRKTASYGTHAVHRWGYCLRRDGW